MGIDIYAKWRNQTPEEEKAQITGFNSEAGDVGYLREAYHGGVYATHYFVDEAFKTGEVQIPAKVLLERLPETLKLVRQRYTENYPSEDDYSIWRAQKSYVDFAILCEKMEKETGEAVKIIASY